MHTFLFRKAVIIYISKNTDRSVVFTLFPGGFLDKKSWGHWGTDHPVQLESSFHLFTVFDVVGTFWLEE